jgi:PAS domain-containing protein
VILRLLRARVKEGEGERLHRYIRDEAVAHALRIPGLRSCQPAIRTTESGAEFLLASTWAGFDDLVAADRDLDRSVSLPGAGSMLTDSHAEHYELVIGDARTMPMHAARLRLTRILIRPNVQTAYYEAVRRWSDRLLDDAGMVAFTLGRRVVGRQDEIVAVQLWQDEEALRDAAGKDLERPRGGEVLSEFWAADPTIEHFEALTSIEPQPNAPAILVADDERRYVHATPAAARLSGRSVARLLTLRIDDISAARERAGIDRAWNTFVADGSMRGPYRLTTPDGSEIPVRISAKANTPWPGAHASVLVPDGSNADADPDIDAALVEAGLVAKYVADA